MLFMFMMAWALDGKIRIVVNFPVIINHCTCLKGIYRFIENITCANVHYALSVVVVSPPDNVPRNDNLDGKKKKQIKTNDELLPHR